MVGLWRRRGRRPRVTVVIATYNWATVLPFSIASVLAQTMQDFELLVVGDGCTDESESVVRAIRDRRVSWHNLARNGRSQAGPNNLGVQLGRSERIAYLGHDDLWLPEHLELLCSAMDGGASFVFGRQLRIDPGRQLYVYPPPDYAYTANDWVAPTAAMHDRADAISVGGWWFPAECGDEDPEANLWTRLTASRGPPTFIEQVTSVKLPASMRRGVYREKPCDEQTMWSARIHAATSSAIFVEAALSDPDLHPPERYSPDDFIPEFQGIVPSTAVERQRLGRRAKGLND